MRRDKRKAELAAIIERVAAMPEDERNALARRINVTNVEGHALSPRNQLLIALQIGCNATIVGGFKQWLKQGRCVRKGQHGAAILFPRTFGDKNGLTNATAGAETAATAEAGKKSNVRFLTGTVFDISQTAPITDKAEIESVTGKPALFIPPPANVVQAVDQFAEPITAQALTIWNSNGVDAPALICAPPREEKLANAREVTPETPKHNAEQFQLI